MRGTNGVFPTARRSGSCSTRTPPRSTVDLNGLATPVCRLVTDWADGDRIGFAVHYGEGDRRRPAIRPRRRRSPTFDGPDFDDDFDPAARFRLEGEPQAHAGTGR